MEAPPEFSEKIVEHRRGFTTDSSTARRSVAISFHVAASEMCRRGLHSSGISDAEAPAREEFAEEEMPTVIAARRHIRTLSRLNTETSDAQEEAVLSAESEASRHEER